MRGKHSKKANIISIRMSDDERAAVQKIMDETNRKASNVMREAFNLFKEKWEANRTTDR